MTLNDKTNDRIYSCSECQAELTSEDEKFMLDNRGCELRILSGLIWIEGLAVDLGELGSREGEKAGGGGRDRSFDM